jgi:multisubunit Na+/H+ antiporter MnhG subunit
MNFDLRKPLGAMFSLIGVMLVVYGLVSRPEIYERSFSLNVNLIWGVVLVVFGVTMLWLGRTRAAPS